MTVTTTFEIEIEATGSIESGYRGDATCPPYDASVVDLDIEKLGLTRRVRFGKPGQFNWETLSLLEGVNTKSPDIQKLFANIIALVGDDLEERLIEDAA